MSVEAVGSVPQWKPDVVIGDIEADRFWIRTPLGVMPAGEAQWSVSSQVRTERYIPLWAVLLTLLFVLMCLLGLLFLLVKEERHYHEVTVTVMGAGFAYTTQVGAYDARVVTDTRAQVAHARALAGAR